MEDPNRTFVVKINKNNTSLNITLPPYLKEVFKGIEKGALISLTLNSVVIKEEEDDK